MVFSSNEFIFFFLPLALVVNLLILLLSKRHKIGVWKANSTLLLFSLLFYAWGEPKYIFLLFGSVFVNYLGGLLLGIDFKKHSASTVVLVSFIAVNLLALVIFKYLVFFQSAGGVALVNRILPESFHLAAFKNIILPIGISFYTFQGISYLVDVYRKDIPSCKSFVAYACYLTMFPQLIAGPIVRFRDVHEDLLSRDIFVQRFLLGCSRFIIGLAKKVLVADTFAKVADMVFSFSPENVSASHAWLGLLCYTFQIYYDFSGYSDMAIGIGNILGINFKENFLYPYSSRSIKEFWRRWHISLSSWFRDYLYIPLGGSRKGNIRLYSNLLIVFTLCGLWHGASWNFVLWGLFHGFFLVMERIVAGKIPPMPAIIQWCYSFFVVMMGWVLFRADNVSAAMGYYRALLGLTTSQIIESNSVRLAAYGYVLPICFVVAFIGAMPVYPYLTELVQRKFKHGAGGLSWLGVRTVCYVCLFFVFALIVGSVTSSSYQSFIYFRF